MEEFDFHNMLKKNLIDCSILNFSMAEKIYYIENFVIAQSDGLGTYNLKVLKAFHLAVYNLSCYFYEMDLGAKLISEDEVVSPVTLTMQEGSYIRSYIDLICIRNTTVKSLRSSKTSSVETLSNLFYVLNQASHLRNANTKYKHFNAALRIALIKCPGELEPVLRSLDRENVTSYKINNMLTLFISFFQKHIAGA